MVDVLARLEAELGDCVQTDAGTLASHRRDSWVLAELQEREGRLGDGPLAVVSPRSTDEVALVLRTCRATRTPVVPYGGGSGVCGAIRPGAGAIVLDTRRIAGLRSLDRESALARFGAGTQGSEAEERVRAEGFTIGHWPQSIALSTVGGWVATRASGQYSTAYGSIEDLVLALEVVLPDGSVLRTRETPRASAGPDLRQLFLGSEGTLGVVSEVVLSLRPLPECERRQAFQFGTSGSGTSGSGTGSSEFASSQSGGEGGIDASGESFGRGLAAVRKLVQRGFRPPVVRLYDPPESQRHFGEASREGTSMLVLLHEGPRALVDAEAAAIAALCRESGGEDADPAVVDHWLEHRNRVPSFATFLDQGIIVDTIEVAATWSRVELLYARVTRSLAQVPGILVATAHSSHSYRSGTNLYFSFAVRPEDPADLERSYRDCWRRTMVATDEVGGGIAHHHGVGRVRRDYLASEVGESGVALLRSVKHALDPDGLLNPGALLPDREPGPS